MNDTETPNLDALIYDLVEGAAMMGGLNNNGIYTGVRDVLGNDVPIKTIDATVDWLRHEGMLRPTKDAWLHIPFEKEMPL